MGKEHNKGELSKILNPEQIERFDRRAQEIAREVRDMQEGVRNVQQGNVGSRPSEDYKKSKSA